jgi:hypothetical protein
VTPELVPLFTTDFTRNFWVLVPQEGTRIEVALDRGKIVAGERQEPICEVELELLEGKVADLFTAASPCRPICRCIPKAPARPSAATVWPAPRPWYRTRPPTCRWKWA